MISFRRTYLAVTVASIFATYASAPAQTVTNGSFESPMELAGQMEDLTGTGWTPENSNTTLIFANGSPFPSTPYGNQYLFLNPNAGASQLVSGFVAGQEYTLTAEFQTIEGTGSNFTLALSGALFGGATFEQSFTPTGTGFYTSGVTIPFQLATLTFIALDSGSGTLSVDDTPVLNLNYQPVGNSGMYVDNVSLTKETSAAPEPSTYALMLAGLTLLGLCLRRRLATR